MNDAPLLQVSGLSRAFGGVRAVDGVDFSLAAGELRCLIGPNGAGKSTFFKCLTGQLKPTAGDIRFSGRDLIGLQTHEIARLGVGVKTQVPSVFGGLSVAENLALAARRERDESLVDQLGIAAILERQVDHLPHGQRQLVELAMVLATEPRLILLDEPTAGLTREEVERVAGLIQSLEHRCATIVVEHDMQFVRAIARTVTVFHQGRTLVEGSVHDIMNNADVRAVYLGKRVA
jgi:ABC-type uncharacterized transport system ATPase subunit